LLQPEMTLRRNRTPRSPTSTRRINRRTWQKAAK
jgi:hypothetical protein